MRSTHSVAYYRFHFVCLKEGDDWGNWIMFQCFIDVPEMATLYAAADNEEWLRQQQRIVAPSRECQWNSYLPTFEVKPIVKRSFNKVDFAELANKSFPMRRYRSPFLTGEIRELIRIDYLAKQLKQDAQLSQRPRCRKVAKSTPKVEDWNWETILRTL